LPGSWGSDRTTVTRDVLDGVSCVTVKKTAAENLLIARSHNTDILHNTNILL